MKFAFTTLFAATLVATGTASAQQLDKAGAEKLMQKYACAACHGIDKKIVGPSYIEVAAKYKGDKDAVAKLSKKVKDGGSGAWGAIPMPPNAQVPDADIKSIVTWIMTLK